MTEDRQRRKRTKMFFLREGRLGNWEPYWLRIIVAAALLVVCARKHVSIDHYCGRWICSFDSAPVGWWRRQSFGADNWAVFWVLQKPVLA